MDVSAVNAATQSQNAAGAPQTVDYQSFLRLLVAQMKNQDPTSPMESTDYVAQLATFSQVEQSVQMNARLEEILAASSLSQASGLVGREITSADGTVTGVVSEVKLYADGVVATLEGGEEVIVGPGVVIR
ncbi:flagellar hook assembly protein FlgD [Nitratireductor sp. GCM10026969]|uniref:flagellar hook assembly protein FlgD n=1 Tax=Nitratireductor sp. GCM10026969 TaxID=3252645 RepID=UPI00361246DC